MDNVKLSKSKYCNCAQCNKILWMNNNMPDKAISKARDSVLENGK